MLTTFCVNKSSYKTYKRQRIGVIRPPVEKTTLLFLSISQLTAVREVELHLAWIMQKNRRNGKKNNHRKLASMKWQFKVDTRPPLISIKRRGK